MKFLQSLLSFFCEFTVTETLKMEHFKVAFELLFYMYLNSVCVDELTFLIPFFLLEL